MVGDLPVEGRIPPPGNSGSARRAGTIRSEIVAGDQIAVAFDEQLVAVGAVQWNKRFRPVFQPLFATERSF
jgi:hypothetical protein